MRIILCFEFNFFFKKNEQKIKKNQKTPQKIKKNQKKAENPKIFNIKN